MAAQANPREQHMSHYWSQSPAKTPVLCKDIVPSALHGVCKAVAGSVSNLRGHCSIWPDTKRDAALCGMYNRLQLLQQLQSGTRVDFVSLQEGEQAAQSKDCDLLNAACNDVDGEEVDNVHKLYSARNSASCKPKANDGEQATYLG